MDSTNETEIVKKVLTEAIEFCEVNYVFDPVRDQPPFATLLGLIVEQGRRFSVTRAIRKKLWTTFVGKTFSPETFLSQFDRLDTIEPDAKRRDLMRRVATRFAAGNDWLNEKGIGPWTRSAHKIMCSNDSSIALEGDSHIRNSMKGITSWSQLKAMMPEKLSQLSRLFWRLSRKGRLHVIHCIHEREPLQLKRAIHFF